MKHTQKFCLASLKILARPRVIQAIFLSLSAIMLGYFLAWPFLWLLFPILLFSEIILLFRDTSAPLPFTNEELSPWKSLRISEGFLHLGNAALPLSSVPTAILAYQYDYVTLQLPQNKVRGKIPVIRFSPVYFPAVKAFIRLRLPDTTVHILASDDKTISDIKKAS